MRGTRAEGFVDVSEFVDEETKQILFLFGFVAEKNEDEVHGLGTDVDEGVQ